MYKLRYIYVNDDIVEVNMSNLPHHLIVYIREEFENKNTLKRINVLENNRIRGVFSRDYSNIILGKYVIIRIGERFLNVQANILDNKRVEFIDNNAFYRANYDILKMFDKQNDCNECFEKIINVQKYINETKYNLDKAFFKLLNEIKTR